MHLDELTKLIESEVSSTGLMADIEAIQKIDRFFTFPKFMESARMVAAKLGSFGIDGKVLEQPADGTTQMGDWTMPMAWDCTEATFELLAPEPVKGKVLCKRSQDPNCTIMWSAPTPEDGVTAEVVGPLSLSGTATNTVMQIGSGENIRPVDDAELAGKIVYTAINPRKIKDRLIAHKVAGVVTGYSPAAEYLPQNRHWINGWSDESDGWAFKASDTPMWGFVLTPAQGKDLEELLAQGTVQARATVKSRIYEGVLPAATGLLKGESSEEILTLGHQFEVGADDSASGCAVMIEAARVLSKLIADGRLPRPQRSLRWLFMSECYGSMAYACTNKRRMQKTLAALNIDCVGGDQRKVEMPLPVALTPGSNPSVADTLMRKLCGGYLWNSDPYFSWFTTGFDPCDSTIADPMIGTPTVYIGGQDKFWHTSADTIDKIDPEATAKVTVLAAAFAYFLASASSPEAEWLAEETCADGRRRLARVSASFARKMRTAPVAKLGRIMGVAREHLNYHCSVAAERTRSAQKFSERSERSEFRASVRPMIALLKKQARNEEAYLQKLVQRLAKDADQSVPETREPSRPEWWSEALKIVPVRKTVGTITFDGIPAEEREGHRSPRWNTPATHILFRCDGKRTLAEAALLGLQDAGQLGPTKDGTNLVEFYRFLEKHGLVELRPAKKTSVKPEATE